VGNNSPHCLAELTLQFLAVKGKGKAIPFRPGQAQRVPGG